MLTAVEPPETPVRTDDESVKEAADLDYREPTASSPDLEDAGLYRAGITGRDADLAMKRTYRNLIMRVAAADLAGTYPRGPRRPGQPPIPFTRVAEALSDLADAALTAALSVAVATTYPDAPVSTRLAVLAMGKCGARELNYISDVDVIFVAEPADARATRLASEFIRVACRCFFEVDAALRPEGKSGALVRTLESHQAYYKRWAQTWEFQAQLKARPMTGDLDLGKEYVEALAPLVWSASQRDSFVEDVQAMRDRVIENVPDELKLRELKLGRGGLRDVEFAVQLLQLVHGRYDESLRVLPTVEALDALVEAGYVGREDGRVLIECYEFMRLLEHRLQLQKMRRTHTLPPEEDLSGRRWLGRAAGVTPAGSESSADALAKRVRATGRQIRTLHNKLFFRPLLNSVVEQDIGTCSCRRRREAAAGGAGLQVPRPRLRPPDGAGVGHFAQGPHPVDAAAHPDGVGVGHRRAGRRPAELPQAFRRAVRRAVVPADAARRGRRRRAPDARPGHVAVRVGAAAVLAGHGEALRRRRDRAEAAGHGPGHRRQVAGGRRAAPQ